MKYKVVYDLKENGNWNRYETEKTWTDPNKIWKDKVTVRGEEMTMAEWIAKCKVSVFVAQVDDVETVGKLSI